MKRRFGDDYGVSPPTAIVYTGVKTVWYALVPFTFTHFVLRSACAYMYGDSDWLLPTAMPAWTEFVKDNPKYMKYDSIFSGDAKHSEKGTNHTTITPTITTSTTPAYFYETPKDMIY